MSMWFAEAWNRRRLRSLARRERGAVTTKANRSARPLAGLKIPREAPGAEGSSWGESPAAAFARSPVCEIPTRRGADPALPVRSPFRSAFPLDRHEKLAD